MLALRFAARRALIAPSSAAAVAASWGVPSLAMSAPSAVAPRSLTLARLNSTAPAVAGAGELATANINLAPPTAEPTAADLAAANDVAKRVNATKRAHQTATPDERARLERSAWNDLNTLTEEQIAAADGQACAILLNAWGYFSKFWARGKEGPA
jgi:hypothetical protein